MTGQRRKMAISIYTGADGQTKYDGTKIENGKLGAYFGVDRNPEELDGVRFTYWKLKDKMSMLR